MVKPGQRIRTGDVVGDTVAEAVIGIDPTTGAQKFSIPITDSLWASSSAIIAGDGYAYVPHMQVIAELGAADYAKLKVLQVDSSGNSSDIDVFGFWTGTELGITSYLITNANQGVLLSWDDFEASGPYTSCNSMSHLATVTGIDVTWVNAPQAPGQPSSAPVVPVLQAQDGSFVGTAHVNVDSPPWVQDNIVAFDATGNVRWVVPGNWQPQIATADGGVIATELDSDGNPVAVVTFDQNGNATGQMGSIATQSWTMNSYLEDGSVQQVALMPISLLFGFAAVQGANPSRSGTHVRPHSAPQEALYALATANLTAVPQCNALMAQFATIAQVPESTLIKQLQATANSARDYVYDGPSSNTPLDPVKFPGAASPGVTTVGQWFGLYDTIANYADGFSQFNGYAVWFRLNDWHSWIAGVSSQFLRFWTGKLNYYAVGTVMHESCTSSQPVVDSLTIFPRMRATCVQRLA
ncbi:MAG TPA: hypothetical protein VLY04_15720 [Bryobacteraceae bacterium]|nr:hypothetical protein [Bryobacteraceae bacterium]